MNKGQMALEYVVKVMILLVVVFVVINLIFGFSDDIKLAIKRFFSRDEDNFNFPEYVEGDRFTAGQLSVYIDNCYHQMVSLPESEQKDVICYVLKSDTGFASISKDYISIPIDLDVTFEMNWNSGIVVKIEYEDVGNKIVVSG